MAARVTVEIKEASIVELKLVKKGVEGVVVVKGELRREEGEVLKSEGTGRGRREKVDVGKENKGRRLQRLKRKTRRRLSRPARRQKQVTTTVEKMFRAPRDEQESDPSS